MTDDLIPPSDVDAAKVVDLWRGNISDADDLRSRGSNIAWLSGKRDNIPALLHEIADDPHVKRIIIGFTLDDAEGTMKFIHVRATGAEMAYAAAYWLQMAMNPE